MHMQFMLIYVIIPLRYLNLLHLINYFMSGYWHNNDDDNDPADDMNDDLFLSVKS